MQNDAVYVLKWCPTLKQIQFFFVSKKMEKDNLNVTKWNITKILALKTQKLLTIQHYNNEVH